MAKMHGEQLKYDPEWKGPLDKRRCTDCCWLLIFVLFLCGWSSVAYYAFQHGNIDKLLHPTDTEGRKCGIDSQVLGKKYLLFFDLSQCIKITPETYRSCPTTQVCVESCPTKNFYYESSRNEPLEVLKRKLICKIDVRLDSVNSIDQIDALVEHERCARWYLNSTSVLKRCLPYKVWDEFLNSTITDPELKKANTFIRSIAEIETTFKKVYHDFKETKYMVLGISIASGVTSVFYIILLRWLATTCVWITIFSILGVLGFSIYHEYFFYINSQYTEWLVILVVTTFIFCLILLATLFLRKRISLACQFLKVSSRAVTSILSTLFFPLIPWVLHLLVITYGISVTIYLLTIYTPNYRVEMLNDHCMCDPSINYRNNATCDPNVFNTNCKQFNGQPCLLSACKLVNKERPWFINYFHAVNLVGFYWLFFFVSAFGEMVLAATFATWYWTLKKRNVPYFTISIGFWRTLRYHLGTLALGSLILTICRIIRLVLEYLNKKVKKANNDCANATMCCCRCFFYLLENFLRFINNNAYIMCAVHGKGFCRSARDAFNLLMRNVIRVVVINKITDSVLFLGKLLITGLTVFATWWYYTSEKTKHPQVNYWDVPYVGMVPYVPIAMTAITSFLIASVFFKVQAAAIDTLFLCFLEDCERNDGSDERPYYMSKRLRKLLHK